MELVKKSNLQVIANTLATILVSAGLTPSDIKETLRLAENLTEEIPYGIKDIRKIQFAMGVCIIKTAEINPSVNKNLYFVEASDRIQDNCKTYNLIIKDI